MKLYVESVYLQRTTDFKQKIILLNYLGDKIIFAHPLVKNAKRIDLMEDVYYELFADELENDASHKKAKTGDELIEFMFELSDELKEEKTIAKRGDELS